MIFAVYDKATGVISKSLDMPEFMIERLILKPNEAIVEIPRMANDATEYIQDGKLTPKPKDTAN
ncbi:hypothetical protein ACPESL_01110 [Psychrobacter pocilloporae]|uniref:hypothetical protein n=1 Tax=Psychrobacter pocilloporae TaxID=1775882 RepID=UPI003C2E6FD9